MSALCEGRIVVVTGAGRGIGRGHALEFARQGARVVVNDLGAEVDGHGGSTGPAGEVVAEIRAAGGEAVANGDDISTGEGAARVVATAVDTWGGLDVVVNNAGILRDRMLVNLTEDEWDDVIRVHLKGTFLMSRAAARHWRERSKAGLPNDGAIVNTSSVSGLYGNVGQSNYGAAKAGIASFTVILAAELGRYGVTVNAISPMARSRMTADGRIGRTTVEEGAFDPYAAENVAPVVVWLGSLEARGVTGQVFHIEGGHVGVMEGWREGPFADKGSRWEPDELGAVIPDLLAEAGATGVMADLQPPAPVRRPEP